MAGATDRAEGEGEGGDEGVLRAAPCRRLSLRRRATEHGRGGGFVLNDGRVVEGFLIDSDEDSYVVKTAHGETTILRADVRRIEGLARTEPPPPPPPGPPSRPVATAPGPASPTAAPIAALTPRREPEPVAKPGAFAGADAMAVAAARAWLADAAALPEEDRAAQLRAAVGRFGCGALVTILVDLEGDPAGDLRAQAKEALRQARGAAKDDLLRATVATRGRALDAIALLEPIFDDSIEAALDGALPALLPEGQAAIAGILERVGTLRSAELLGALVLATSDAEDGALPEAAGAALAAIAAREPEPARVIAAALPNVPTDRLPQGFRLRGLLRALGAAPQETLADLLKIADTVDGERRLADESRRAFAGYRRTWVYVALAATSAPDAVARVTVAVDAEDDPNLRLAWIRGLGGAVRAGRNPALVGWLIARISRQDAEGRASLSALGAITGKWFADNMDLWQAYLQDCRGESPGPRR